mgnify:CR=1 FL=1
MIGENNAKDYAHVAYSDEAYYHGGEYSSICMVSMKYNIAIALEESMKKILKDSGLKELKWSKLGSARERFCALKLIDLIYPLIKQKSIRIDTLIWNNYERKDQRAENNNIILSKMYYHLFKNVLTRRWPSDVEWIIFPDEQGVIDWEELKKILDNVSSKIFIKKKEDGGHIFEIKRDFNLPEIEQVDSKEAPLCQIADFFSGLAAFFHLECSTCNLSIEQQTLNKKEFNFSNKQKERMEVLRYIKDKFSGSSFEITFDPIKGMYTKNPNGQINFWQFKMNVSRYKNKSITDWL